jgi:hypothetical protein
LQLGYVVAFSGEVTRTARSLIFSKQNSASLSIVLLALLLLLLQQHQRQQQQPSSAVLRMT